MKSRLFPALQREVSEIGLGTWQLGGTEWGDVPEEEALNTLAAAAEAGITFIDTADIYGLGRSESLIGRFLKGRPDRDRFIVATKLGRHPEPGWPANFTREVVRRHTEDSLRRLGVDVIDLTQTHSLPLEVMRDTGIFDYLRELRDEGKIRAYGASVESMEEALFCLNVEGMASLQIIFNIFRQKPIDVLFDEAQKRGVALIIRLPLASGLLAGKFTRDTQFAPNDHRFFNRDGEKFNVGETFAGLPFEKGLELVEHIRPWVPSGMTMAQMALRWCLDFDAVTTVIPGAKRPDQARSNAAASDLMPLPPILHNRLGRFYEAQVAAHIRGKY
ncbi:putative oxidoreductase protein [Thermogutta terrifontis]|uniref:Putative oxidoreductase protein n=1 Tax=Thermogutta terrifontis TaxID=1331910 RepID=A0A286RM44_9BACT|nr:aldo/keto reductase [Thermogutta terrifontis]ASV76967.1 putative oxidoreductase protein [Thermogutta terrifontis]